MMEKLQAVKQAADSELSKQKQSYEERLQDLEGTLVGVALLVHYSKVHCVMYTSIDKNETTKIGKLFQMVE